MQNDIHFISGLPRAGSTLLAALLRQNPTFKAGMSGPAGALVNAMQSAMSMSNETSIFISDDQRETLLKKIFETFHGGLPAGHVSFDTNRMWCAKLPLLTRLFPNAKIICCVRDVAAIVNSIERIVHANTLQPSGIFSFEPGGTVYSRADGIAGGTGLVGAAYNALREAFYGPHADRLLLVTYETLVREPHAALKAIYAFIGQPIFDHDVDDIRFDADEFDRQIGTPGLHKVGRKVQALASPMLLPPDLARRFQNDAFWLDPSANTKGVRVI